MLISIGEFKLKSLLLLLAPLFMALRGYLETKIKEKNKNFFFNGFLRFLARSSVFIFWIFYRKAMASKKKEKQKIISSQNKTINDNDNDLKNNKKKFINQFDLEKEKDERKLMIIKSKKSKNSLYILIFIAFFDFFSVSIHILISEVKIQKDISLGLLTIFSCIRIYILAILSLILIKYTKSYAHHYFSAINIGIVGLIMVTLSFIFEKEETNEDFLIKLLLMIIPEILFSIMFTLGYIYLVNTDGNLYKILFINGITGITLSIFLQIIFYFFKCNNIELFNQDFNFCDKEKNKFITVLYNFKSFNNFNGIISISVIITNFFENIFIFLLIYSFSINHFGASFPMSSILLQFIQKTYSGDDLKYPYIVGCLIIIFMSLVYNEFIILKFCGFDKNTKIEIRRRAILEFNSISSIENDKEKDDFPSRESLV